MCLLLGRRCSPFYGVAGVLPRAGSTSGRPSAAGPERPLDVWTYLLLCSRSSGPVDVLCYASQPGSLPSDANTELSKFVLLRRPMLLCVFYFQQALRVAVQDYRPPHRQIWLLTAAAYAVAAGSALALYR